MALKQMQMLCTCVIILELHVRVSSYPYCSMADVSDWRAEAPIAGPSSFPIIFAKDIGKVFLVDLHEMAQTFTQ